MTINEFIFYWIVFTISFFILGCASIPDIKVIKPLPFGEGAYETSTLSDHKKTYTQPEWDSISWKAMCLMPEEFAKIKANWLKSCKAAGPKCIQSLEKIDNTNKFLDELMKGLKE